MTKQYIFWRVFTAACMGMLLFGMVIIILGSMLPSLIAKFHLNEIKAGSLTAILPSGILVGSLFFGPIVDRHSYKYLLITCVLLIMIGIEGIALTENIQVLHLSIFLIGLGGGAINGGTNALVVDISDANPSKRSANLSLLGVFFGVGALGMPSLLGWLSENNTPYYILSLIGCSLLLPILFLSLTKFPQPKQTQSIPLKKVLSMIKDTSLLMLGFILFFQSGVEAIVNNWTTLFLQSDAKFVSEDALFALSFFVLSLTLTRVLLSILLNYIRSYIILILSIITVIIGTICFMIPELPAHEITGLVLLGIGLAAGFPVILGYVSALYPQASGTVFSLVFVIAMTGNILLNFLMGIFSQYQGVGVFTLLLLIGAICLFLVLIVTLNKISSKIRI